MSTISIGRISTAPNTEIRLAVDHAKGVVDLRQFDLIGHAAGVFTPSRIGLLVPLDRLSSLIATPELAQAQVHMALAGAQS